MSTLTRYLNRMVLVRLAAVLASLWAFALLFDLLDVSEDLIERGGAAFAAYVVLRTPTLLAELLPIAAVLAGLFTMADLLRHVELPVMWAAGVSPGGIMRRLWPVCALLFVLSLVNADLAVPKSVEVLRAWGVGDFGADGPGVDRGRLWLRQGDAVLRVPLLRPGAKRDGLLVFRLDEAGNLTERIEAAGARVDGDRWRLEGVTRQTLGPGGGIRREATLAWPNEVAQDRLALLARPPGELGLLDLLDLIRQDGYGVASVSSQRTALWHRLAGAFVPALMVLLAAGLAGGFRRQGLIGPLFLKGMAAAFVYIILSGVAVALAEAGLVPAPLGTAAPVLALAALVVVLARRSRSLEGGT